MKPLFKTKRMCIATLLALVMVVAVGATLALMASSPQFLTNTFAAADVDTDVDENTDGANVKTVWIENNGKSPVYVRARIMVSGVNPENIKVVTAEPTGEAIDEETLYLVMPNVGESEDWEQATGATGKDDYYYYKKVLPGKEEDGTTNSTSLLLEKVVVGSGLVEQLKDNPNFSVTVYHESVLAIGDAPGTSLNDVVTAFNTADGNTTSSTTP